MMLFSLNELIMLAAIFVPIAAKIAAIILAARIIRMRIMRQQTFLQHVPATASTMIRCPYCGNGIEQGNAFCGKCGNKYLSEASAQKRVGTMFTFVVVLLIMSVVMLGAMPLLLFYDWWFGFHFFELTIWMLIVLSLLVTTASITAIILIIKIARIIPMTSATPVMPEAQPVHITTKESRETGDI